MENFHGKKFCGQSMRENLNLLTVERPRKGDNYCSFGKRLCGGRVCINNEDKCPINKIRLYDNDKTPSNVP
jgi:hypothetical protein